MKKYIFIAGLVAIVAGSGVLMIWRLVAENQPSLPEACAAKTGKGLVVHEGCEPGEQAYLIEVRTLLGYLPDDLAAEKPGTVIEPEAGINYQEFIPKGSRLILQPDTWRRTNSNASAEVKIVSEGVFPFTESVLMSFMNTPNGWRVFTTHFVND